MIKNKMVAYFSLYLSVQYEKIKNETSVDGTYRYRQQNKLPICTLLPENGKSFLVFWKKSKPNS